MFKIEITFLELFDSLQAHSILMDSFQWKDGFESCDRNNERIPIE